MLHSTLSFSRVCGWRQLRGLYVLRRPWRWDSGLRAVLLLAPVLAVGLMHRRLKRIPLAGAAYIAAAWLVVVVGLPAVMDGQAVNLGWVAAIVGTALLASTIASDVRDVGASLDRLGPRVAVRTARALAALGVVLAALAPVSVRPLAAVPAFTLASVLRPWGRVFIQSGNIKSLDLPDDEWIIDETVEAIHRQAVAIVREDDAFRRYRPALEEAEYMSAHDVLRRKYFLPVRPLDHYLDSLRSEGFEVTGVQHRRIPARVSEWFDFLSVYHEGALGWIGGAEKTAGVPASEEVIGDRLSIMRLAMREVFHDAFEFGASWTYITCEPRG